MSSRSTVPIRPLRKRSILHAINYLREIKNDVALIELNVIQPEERFRAELASVETDGRRKWIYAKKPKGAFYRWRTAVSVALLAFLAISPFAKIGSEQFLLFDLLNRKFVFFGYPIWQEDFYLVVILFLTGLVSIVV